MSSSAVSTLVLPVKDCKVSRVVVYRDRAEVTRSVICTSTVDSGELTLVVAGITKSAMLDTVSVRAIHATTFDILEVSHENVTIPLDAVTVGSSATANSTVDGSVTESAIATLTTQIAQEEDDLVSLTKQAENFESSLTLLKTFSESALRKSSSTTSSGELITVEYAQSILEFRFKEAGRLDQEILQTRREIARKESLLKKLKQDLRAKTNEDKAYPTINLQQNLQNLSITVEVKDASVPIELTFSYIVPSASWVASYDVRVTTTDTEEVLSLSYFGEVTQSSGEDWLDCDLLLSTSNPAISADPPAMKSKTVDFYQNYPQPSYAKAEKRKTRKPGALLEMEEERGFGRNASFSALDEAGGFPEMEAMDTSFLQNSQQAVFRKATVEGTGDAGSTVFTINRKVRIESDSKPHKVMIAAKKFKPQVVHYTIPSTSPHVYIQAKAKNNSGYPLLASEKVNIYLDGNYVSKSSLKQANNGETFQFFIGVDPAVKVEYMPTKYEEYKKGWMNGNGEVKKVFHRTVIHNTKGRTIHVIVVDSLPRSSNEKIAVELVEPSQSSLLTNTSQASFSSATEAITNLTNMNDDNTGSDNGSVTGAENRWPNDFVTLNKTNNNLIWFKTVREGQKLDLPFTYRLSWPNGNSVYINEYF